MTKHTQDNEPASANVSGKGPSRPDTPIYHVMTVAPEKLLANTITKGSDEKPPANPPVNKRILLQAFVVDESRNPPPKGTSVTVNWTVDTNTMGDDEIWWYTDLKQEPKRRTQTSSTDVNGAGVASIWISGTDMISGMVRAAVQDNSEDQGKPVTLAFWDFNGAQNVAPDGNPDQLLKPTPEITDPVPIPDYDFGDPDSYNPELYYYRSGAIKPDPNLITGYSSYFIRHWNYQDNKDVLLSPPKVWSGGETTNIYIPYGIMNTSTEVDEPNAVTLCFYSNFNPYAYLTAGYSAAGSALVLPDPRNKPITGWLPAPVFVETDVDPDWQSSSDPDDWPIIADWPPVITKDTGFGDTMLLNVAIPMYENWNENDYIVVTAYMNAYLKGGKTPHNKIVAPLNSKDPYVVLGKQFSSNFQNKAEGIDKYGLVQFNLSDMLEFYRSSDGKNGIMYIQYELNRQFYSNYTQAISIDIEVEAALSTLP